MKPLILLGGMGVGSAYGNRTRLSILALKSVKSLGNNTYSDAFDMGGRVCYCVW